MSYYEPQSGSVAMSMPMTAGFTDNSKSFAKKYAGVKIKSYTAARTPIQEFIGKYISGKYKNLPYDKLFHLFIILELEDGTFILTEKNPDTIFKKVDGNVVDNRGAESFLVPLVFNPPTYGEFIENLRKLQGKRFNQYDALKNNCQDYVLDCVNALYGLTNREFTGLSYDDRGDTGANPEIIAFIKQDVSDIFYGADFKFAKFITDTYGSIKSFFGGVAVTGVDIAGRYSVAPKGGLIGLPFDPRYSYHDPTKYGFPAQGGFDRAKYTGVTKNLETGETGVKWKKHKGGLSLHWRAPEANKKVDIEHYYDKPAAKTAGSLGKWHWV